MDALLHNIGASSVAALAARLASHPLDTAKTKIQADPRVRSTDVAAVLRHVYAGEGVRGLYRGLPISLAFSMPAVSTYLAVYDATKAAIGASALVPWSAASPATHFFAAIVAELCSGAFWTPLELIKNKQQVHAPPSAGASAASLEAAAAPLLPKPELPTVRAIARRIYRADGVLGFFKGYWLSLTVFVPYSIVYFLSYEQLKAAYARHLAPPERAAPPLPLHGYLVCAALSGALAAAASNPLDRVKTIVQASETRLRDRDFRLLAVVRRLAREEGWLRAATRGVVSRCAWAVPNVVVSMVVYEALKVQVGA